MSFTRQYFKEYNFLLTTITDEVNAEELIQHVIQHNKEFKDVTGLKELADCRGITCVKSLKTQTVVDTANYTEINKPNGMLALLTLKNNDVVFGLANAYKMFSEEHHKEVKLFTQFDEAISWLVENDAKKNDLIEIICNV